jgi:hypothetical protein
MATRKNKVRSYTRTEQVQTTLTRAEREALDAYAAARTSSRADAIRHLNTEGVSPPAPVDVNAYHAEVARLRDELRGLL